MDTLFQYSIFTFRQINPANKFSSFTYQDLTAINQLNAGDCYKGCIVKIDGAYYEYAGEKKYYTHSSEKQKSIIQVKSGRQLLIELLF